MKLRSCKLSLLFLFLTATTLVATTLVKTAVAVPNENLSGTIKIDGSSTVYPITEAVAEEFGKLHSDVNITVGIAGTGGGFKKFSAGEIDIADASRPIKAEEAELAKKNGVDYVELPVSYDALTVVVNPKNTWAKHLTVAELKRMWEPAAQGKITNWNQIRSDFPNKPLKLYGAGVDSGTYDYFTEAIVGTSHSSRGDFTSSEDDNVLVQGVSQDENALGFFGLAYYEENKNKLRAVPIDDENASNGSGPQMPTLENVGKGTYRPLARPLFIYVRTAALSRPEVKSFTEFYLNQATTLTKDVGYIPLEPSVYKLASDRLQKGSVGSLFQDTKATMAKTLEEVMRAGT